MGKQMIKSWEAPQFTHFSVVNCEQMAAYRKSLPFKVSYTTILIKAVADTIAEYPVMNASWDDGTVIIQNETINMGVAVDTKRGLLVPVIRDADKLPLEEIHRCMEDIKNRSGKGNFTMNDLSGGTFVVSNLGMFNISTFTAIVNAPNSAIISVGKMEEVPLVKDGEIVIGKTMTIALNMDHRVIDGATGAKFLTALVERLETLNE
ncbi:Dihydrolipoamide acetyltransferase component of pyruvate dehydrogenase complex [Anaerostipes rhamnosivorans]|uniref:Dihydrolipoamide acetyltransferase component of pyruvate dehydrogenase complex n=2 Tax=Anaerostipes rhamnosivorans TaxID=1229621 RepID=A0A4P8IHC1_9FIRM|nr:Dihydrolipoamide acetyltransferase component of pyruvate dehydrogenase complex [Anaerostipes rhamnosivorans]